ncbi:MAG: lipoyl(octanoyl) transferase LipB [Ignavibacteria bacterium]|nr:lipoyl(octanoyl) transferase LipB [Ignavibacteria bacterium]
MRKLNVINLSQLQHFGVVWEFQRKLHQLRQSNLILDTLILLEHFPVYTLGKNSKDAHLLVGKDFLQKQSIEVFEIDRGGDVTYHGPGQIVGYPIIKLDELYLDIHRYLRDLEEVIILSLKDFGLNPSRDEDYTGVWIGKNKICALGVKVSRWVTMHGFALNVNTDLRYFDNIIPCGIFHKGVTKLESELKQKVDLEKVKEKIILHFADVFQYDSSDVFFSLEEFEGKYLSVKTLKDYGLTT